MVNPRTVVTPGLARARVKAPLRQRLRLVSWGGPCLLRGPSFKGGPSMTETPCPTVLKYRRLLLMGWSGRAPAPPASEAGKGRQRQGARHVSDTQYRDRRDRHRYRQELVPRRGPRCARRHRAAAKVVAWPSGSAARQYTALPDRHGSLRRRTSPEPQTRIAWSRCQVDAGQI